VTGPEGPELSVVLPVYNEAENIGRALRGFTAHVRTHHEILIVYDFDEDTTLPVVRELLHERPEVSLHRNEYGHGVLNAMKLGMDRASAPYILISMADGSDDVSQVDNMVELARSGVDVVAASRYMRGGRQIGGPRLKRTLSRLAGLTLHWFGGVPIHDSTNNFKLYSRSFLDTVSIESRGGFELAIELSVKATLAGRRLAEVPTTWRDRTSGESRFRFSWLPSYVHWYLYLFRSRMRRKRLAR